MAGLGGDVSDHAVIERARIGCVENGSRGRGHIPVDQNRNALGAGRQNGTGHGSDLTTTEAAQDFQRIAQMRLVKRHRFFHGSDLALQHFALGTCARSDPVLRLAAIERVEDRGCNRRVADAHLADAEQVGPAGNGFHAERHRGRTASFIEGGFHRDVAGRDVEREIEYLKAQIIGYADLVDRSTTGRKIVDHLLGDGGRERRDTLLGHAVVSGKNCDQRTVHSGRTTGPCGEPEGDFLKASERAGGLRQLRIALAGRDELRRIGFRQVVEEFPKVVEWQAAGAHVWSFSSGPHDARLRRV